MKNKILVLLALYCFLTPNMVFSATNDRSRPHTVGVLRQIIAENDQSPSGEIRTEQTWYGVETESGLVPISTKQENLADMVNKQVILTIAKNGSHSVQLTEEAKAETMGPSVAGELNIPQPSFGPRNILVVMVNFQNDPRQVASETQIRTALFRGPNSANAFLLESSYNSLWLEGQQVAEGDVQTWVTIPFNNTNCATNMFNAWTQSADNMAEANGFSKTNYQFRFYMFPSIPGCTFTANATIGTLGDPNSMTRAWFQLPDDSSQLNSRIRSFYHEAGHMLGVPRHSGFQETETSPVIDADDRGDFLAGVGGYYPSNVNRVRFGWLRGKIEVHNQPTTRGYTLTPPSVISKGAKVIRIPLKDALGNYIGKSIWIESRKNMSSFFEFFATNHLAYRDGITIRYVEDDLVNVQTKPIVRDTTPGSPIGADDAPLQQGLSYTDSTYGVTIQLVRASDSLGDRVVVTTTR